MKKGLILFADGFEDCEGITTRDILLRGGAKIFTVSISKTKSVITSHALEIKTDFLLTEIKMNDYDYLIIPGGLIGVQNLLNCQQVITMIHFFMKHNKDIYAICAAPYILGKLGYLDHKRFTCYPGCEEGINGIYTNEPVTHTSDHIITAKGPAYTVNFALAILKKNVDFKTYEKTFNSFKGDIIK